MRYHVYMTEEDERPLLEFIRSTGGLIVPMYSRDWPPAPLSTPPLTCSEHECLAIWYPDVIGKEELCLPECHPERGPHGFYEGWELPLVTFQRQWYWKRQATILAVEMDIRAFRPNRPEESAFTSDEIVDFEYRLAKLVRHATEIRDWCRPRLREGYIGEGAWRESESLRQAVESQRHSG